MVPVQVRLKVGLISKIKEGRYMKTIFHIHIRNWLKKDHPHGLKCKCSNSNFFSKLAGRNDCKEEWLHLFWCFQSKLIEIFWKKTHMAKLPASRQAITMSSCFSILFQISGILVSQTGRLKGQSQPVWFAVSAKVDLLKELVWLEELILSLLCNWNFSWHSRASDIKYSVVNPYFAATRFPLGIFSFILSPSALTMFIINPSLLQYDSTSLPSKDPFGPFLSHFRDPITTNIFKDLNNSESMINCASLRASSCNSDFCVFGVK